MSANANAYNPFYPICFSDKTYGVECMIVIYREALGKHPDFLKGYEGDEKKGFNTKFYLLIKDELEKEEALAESESLNLKYGDLIDNCEDTGNWDDFPFKENEIVYYK